MFTIESTDASVIVRAVNGGFAVLTIDDLGAGLRVTGSVSLPGDLGDALALAKVYVEALELAIKRKDDR